MFLPLVLTSLLFLLMAAFITSTDSFKLLLAGFIALIILYIAALAVLPVCMAIEAPSQIFAATVVAKVILIPFYVFQIKTILQSSGLILGGIIFPIALTQSIYGTLIVIFFNSIWCSLVFLDFALSFGRNLQGQRTFQNQAIILHRLLVVPYFRCNYGVNRAL